MGWKLQASFQWNSLWFHSSLLGQTWEWFEWGRQPGPWLCRAAGQRSRAMAAAAGSFPTAMPALKPTRAWGYSHNLNSLAWALTPLIGFQSSGQPTASVSLCSSSNFWIHCQVIVPGLSTWMKINKSVRTTMKDPVCLCACVSVLCPLGLHAEEGEPRSICCVVWSWKQRHVSPRLWHPLQFAGIIRTSKHFYYDVWLQNIWIITIL